MVLSDFQLIAWLEEVLNDIVGNVKYHGLCLRKQKRPEEPGISNNRKKLMMFYYNSWNKKLHFSPVEDKLFYFLIAGIAFKSFAMNTLYQLHPIISQGEIIFKHKITQLIFDITIISRQDTDLEDDLIISSSLFS